MGNQQAIRGLELVTFPAVVGEMVVASVALARALGVTVEELAREVRDYVHTPDGAALVELARGDDGAVIRLTLAGDPPTEIELIFARLDFSNQPHQLVTVAVRPEERALGEESLAELARRRGAAVRRWGAHP